MSRSDRVLFISAGMARPKKRDHPLARRQLYLNYGALTLATLLSHHGVPAVLLHGSHNSPSFTLAVARDQGLIPSRFPVMLSLPSFYALSWAQEFCRLLRAADPASRIVVGGRWVTGPDPEWLKGKLSQVDVIVPGLGEEAIGGLVGLPIEAARQSADRQIPTFPLDHQLVQGFDAFQPSVEVSRGCGMGCAFCEERDIPLSRLRDPVLIADHLEIIRDQYAGGEIHPYLQSSFFLPNVRWAAALNKEVRRRKLDIAWRCESRVDALKPETVELLAASGLKVIDLGLETASPGQIVAMNKANNVDRYLRSASDLLNSCQANGVWVKANVLLYAGETERTVSETRGWLDQHADAIKGVSVGPVVVYGPPRLARSLIDDLASRGGRILDADAADQTGISAIHPSAEMDANAAERISIGLSRRYMNKDDYFDLKSFSYYPRGFSRREFEADVMASDECTLPFRAA